MTKPANPNRKYGRLAFGIRRDLTEKGWVPLRYWVIWMSGLIVAIGAFYVLLTPLWMGLRAIAWLSDRYGAGSRR
jgi:hypothetical protein